MADYGDLPPLPTLLGPEAYSPTTLRKPGWVAGFGSDSVWRRVPRDARRAGPSVLAFVFHLALAFVLWNRRWG